MIAAGGTQLSSNIVGASGAVLAAEQARSLTLTIGSDVLVTANRALTGGVIAIKDVPGAGDIELLGRFSKNRAPTMGGLLALTNTSLPNLRFGKDSQCLLEGNSGTSLLLFLVPDSAL